MGITEENQGTYAQLADYGSAPADEAWVYSCVKRLYMDAQSVPLRVYQYQSDGLDLTPIIGGDPGPAHDAGLRLQHLLDWVNPIDMNGSDLKAYTMASWAVWGGCYWKKIRGRAGGEPQELFWIAAPDTTPHAPDGRQILWYDYHSKTAPIEQILPKDIVAFRDVNLSNPIEMLSPLSAARKDMEVQKSASAHTAATLKNFGIPAGAWVVPAGQEITNQDRSVIQRVLRSLRGPQNAGKSAILPAGLEWQPLALHSNDAEWLAARQISRMTVCAVLGVPLVVAGDDEKLTTYGSLRDAFLWYWRNTVVPRLNWIADMINGWLVPDFDKTGQIRVAFDYTQIFALQDPETVRWNNYLAGIQNQAITPNEFRSHFRIGKPLPDGDRVTPKTSITLRPDLTAPVDPNIQNQIPALNPTNLLASHPQTVELFEPGGAEGDEADLPSTLRSYGKRLYRLAAVRNYVANGGPLDVTWLELPVTDDQRHRIEDGLTRRNSAAQIAAALEQP